MNTRGYTELHSDILWDDVPMPYSLRENMPPPTTGRKVAIMASTVIMLAHGQ